MTRSGLGALAAAVLLILSGCARVPSPAPSVGTPVDTMPGATADDAEAPPTNWVSPIPGSTTACAADTGYAINEIGEYWLSGGCAAVSISGDGSDVQSAGTITVLGVQGQDNDVDARTIGRLTMAGDGNDVDADAITTVSIAGRENDVSVADLEALLVNGDSNRIEADRRIGSLTVNGNDNEIEAQAIDRREVVGTGNRIAPSNHWPGRKGHQSAHRGQSGRDAHTVQSGCAAGRAGRCKRASADAYPVEGCRNGCSSRSAPGGADASPGGRQAVRMRHPVGVRHGASQAAPSAQAS